MTQQLALHALGLAPAPLGSSMNTSARQPAHPRPCQRPNSCSSTKSSTQLSSPAAVQGNRWHPAARSRCTHTASPKLHHLRHASICRAARPGPRAPSGPHNNDNTHTTSPEPDISQQDQEEPYTSDGDTGSSPASARGPRFKAGRQQRPRTAPSSRNKLRSRSRSPGNRPGLPDLRASAEDFFLEEFPTPFLTTSQQPTTGPDIDDSIADELTAYLQWLEQQQAAGVDLLAGTPAATPPSSVQRVNEQLAVDSAPSRQVARVRKDEKPRGRAADVSQGDGGHHLAARPPALQPRPARKVQQPRTAPAAAQQPADLIQLTTAAAHEERLPNHQVLSQPPGSESSVQHLDDDGGAGRPGWQRAEAAQQSPQQQQGSEQQQLQEQCAQQLQQVQAQLQQLLAKQEEEAAVSSGPLRIVLQRTGMNAHQLAKQVLRKVRAGEQAVLLGGGVSQVAYSTRVLAAASQQLLHHQQLLEQERKILLMSHRPARTRSKTGDGAASRDMQAEERHQEQVVQEGEVAQQAQQDAAAAPAGPQHTSQQSPALPNQPNLSPPAPPAPFSKPSASQTALVSPPRRLPPPPAPQAAPEPVQKAHKAAAALPAIPLPGPAALKPLGDVLMFRVRRYPDAQDLTHGDLTDCSDGLAIEAVRVSRAHLLEYLGHTKTRKPGRWSNTITVPEGPPSRSREHMDAQDEQLGQGPQQVEAAQPTLDLLEYLEGGHHDDQAVTGSPAASGETTGLSDNGPSFLSDVRLTGVTSRAAGDQEAGQKLGLPDWDGMSEGSASVDGTAAQQAPYVINDVAMPFQDKFQYNLLQGMVYNLGLYGVVYVSAGGTWARVRVLEALAVLNEVTALKGGLQPVATVKETWQRDRKTGGTSTYRSALFTVVLSEDLSKAQLWDASQLNVIQHVPGSPSSSVSASQPARPSTTPGSHSTQPSKPLQPRSAGPKGGASLAGRADRAARGGRQKRAEAGPAM